MRIDLWLQFLAIGVAVVVQGAISGHNVWINLLSAAIFGAVYFGVYFISKGKFGLGDVYFGIFQGLFLPVKMLPVCLAVEVIAALVIEVIIKRSKTKFPFIPYMTVGLIGGIIIESVWL